MQNYSNSVQNYATHTKIASTCTKIRMRFVVFKHSTLKLVVYLRIIVVT
nr:MAG TPA: hypothetical protein [Caudoviricetes sp.]